MKPIKEMTLLEVESELKTATSRREELLAAQQWFAKIMQSPIMQLGKVVSECNIDFRASEKIESEIADAELKVRSTRSSETRYIAGKLVTLRLIGSHQKLSCSVDGLIIPRNLVADFIAAN